MVTEILKRGNQTVFTNYLANNKLSLINKCSELVEPNFTEGKKYQANRWSKSKNIWTILNFILKKLLPALMDLTHISKECPEALHPFISK